jgi:hypothetical protein
MQPAIQSIAKLFSGGRRGDDGDIRKAVERDDGVVMLRCCGNEGGRCVSQGLHQTATTLTV